MMPNKSQKHPKMMPNKSQKVPKMMPTNSQNDHLDRRDHHDHQRPSCVDNVRNVSIIGVVQKGSPSYGRYNVFCHSADRDTNTDTHTHTDTDTDTATDTDI